MQFRVLRGRHTQKGADGNQVDYGPNQDAGDIVESEIDLTEKFSNKFQRLDGQTKTAKMVKGNRDVFDRDDVLDHDNKELLEQLKEKARAELEKEYEEKLRKAEAKVSKQYAKATNADLSEDEEETEEEEQENLGEDVTEHFESAEDKGLTVHKKGRNYSVVDTDGKKVSGRREMTRKDQVNQFIDKYEAEDAEAEEEEEE